MGYNRFHALQEFLKSSSTEWVLITDSISVRYLSGFSSSNVALLCSLETNYLLTDFRYQEAAETFCADSVWHFVPLKKGLAVTLSGLVSKETSISFQSNYVTIDQFEAWQEELPQVTFTGASKQINRLFSPKQDEELSAIADAAAIADKAYRQIRRELVPGISEYDAARRLDDVCREFGSEGPSFDTIMLFGSRSALPHGVPSKEVILQKGDMVLTDFGCTVQGFCSDMTRTTYCESLTEKQNEIYTIVLNAQLAGKDALHPGVKVSEIDGVVRKIIDDAGYGDYFGHGTGHGVGLRIHESPAVNAKDTTVLTEGMVVTVEPGIYLPDVGGVRIEDLMVITTDGARSLSHSGRELQELSEYK